MAKITELWVEKYRPKNLAEYIFQNESHKHSIERMLEEQTIPHLLFCGVQGSGKTALAKILISKLGINEMDLITVNASDKTGIDYIRDTIIGFAETCPIGKLKIVHLEEFDYLSPNAQAMLRVVMEETSGSCRFIATCNYENKIIPAIKSRMQVMRFKAPNEDEVFVQLATMLGLEEVNFDPELLFTYIKQAYPDIRKTINNLQLNTFEKTLTPPSGLVEADYKFVILDLLKSGDFRTLYETVLASVPAEDIEGLYEFLWQNLKLIPGCADPKVHEKAVLIIANYLRSHSMSAFPHITFQACCIEVMMAVL